MLDRRSRKDLQNVHERQIIGEWVAQLAASGRSVGTPVFGDAPDCVVRIDGLATSVELTCGYADAAAALWQLEILKTVDVANPYMSSSGSAAMASERLVVGTLVDALRSALQATLDRHCRSTFGRSYLILDPSHDELAASLAQLVDGIVVPEDCGFTGIYVAVPQFGTPRRFAHLAGAA